MYCAKCGNYNTKVIDSRLSSEGRIIRRRRECENCTNRFTTFEKIEIVDLIVKKSGNRIERYNREKIEDSILKACNKRSISISKVNNLISDLEVDLIGKDEISSKEIGKYVLEKLKFLDDVAYIRYASVNLGFETANDFLDFIETNKK